MSDTKIILKDVRCSYVYVTHQRRNKKKEETGYGIQVFIAKDDPQYKLAMRCVKKALENKRGKGAWEKRGKYKLPIRDGDKELSDGEKEGAEYKGMYFFNANSKKKKPGIVNRFGQTPTEKEIEDLCFSGATFHASLDFYWFDGDDGSKPGIAAGLRNVMLRKAGDRLDGTVSASDDFADYAESSDDDDGLDDFDEDDIDDL